MTSSASKADVSSSREPGCADPVRLAPFEEYMFLDDQPDFPMVHYLEMDVRGTLDRDEFQLALLRCASRHLRFRSTVERCTEGLCWVPSPNEDMLRWQSESERDTHDGASFTSSIAVDRLDLEKHRGVRVYVYASDDSTLVRFQFHHSACDGVGGTQFAKAVLAEYDELSRSRQDANAPASRHDVGATSPAPRDRESNRHRLRIERAKRILAYPITLGFGLRRLRDFLRLRAIPFVPRDQRPSAASRDSLLEIEPTPDSPAIVSQTLSVSQSRQLFAYAKRSGVTVNDLLMRDVFCCVQDQIKVDPQLGKSSSNRVRLLTPVNLRASHAAANTISNRVGMVFIDRTTRQLNRPTELLRGVHRELSRIKRWYLGETSIRTLGVRRRLPGGLKAFLASRSCWATAVLSNLGRPFSDERMLAGECVVDNIRFIAPIRHETRIAFGAVTYADRLTICLQYDPDWVSRPQATDMMRELSSNLTRHAPKPPTFETRRQLTRT